jgi:hypothetical protein
VAPTALTDDRGVFRLAPLPPGDYVVAAPMTAITVPISAAEALRAGAAGGSPTALAEQARVRAETGAIVGPVGIRVGDHALSGTPGRGMATLPIAPSTPGGPLLAYPTLYFAGATTASQASAVTVASGEERVGVDFAMRAVPATRVSGVLTGPEGPAADHGVRLLPADVDTFVADSGLDVAITVTDAAGRFTFLGITPGQYELRAQRVPRAGAGTPMPAVSVVGGIAEPLSMSGGATPLGDLLWAEMTVPVGDTPVDGLTVMLRPGLRVSGRIEFEGALPRPTPRQMAAVSISLTSADTRTAAPTRQWVPDPNTGQFTTTGLPPGRYVMNVSPPGPGFTLKSIMMGGVNALAEPVRLESGDIANAIVTFSDRTTELAGTVQGLPARADAAAMVVMFPADYQRWLADGAFPRRLVSMRADATGNFQTRIAVPGEYLIVAIPPEDYSAEQTPDFFASLARVATPISITHGERQTATLSLRRLR